MTVTKLLYRYWYFLDSFLQLFLYYKGASPLSHQYTNTHFLFPLPRWPTLSVFLLPFFPFLSFYPSDTNTHIYIYIYIYTRMHLAAVDLKKADRHIKVERLVVCRLVEAKDIRRCKRINTLCSILVPGACKNTTHCVCFTTARLRFERREREIIKRFPQRGTKGGRKRRREK